MTPPPFRYLHGALVRSGLGPTYGATVEQHTDGARMIAVVASDYATSLLDSLTSGFLREGEQSAPRSDELIRAVAPPFASGGALLITDGAHGYVALAGSGRCCVERDGAVRTIEAGLQKLADGDRWLVSIGDLNPREVALFASDPPADAPASFHNDLLDGALKTVMTEHAELKAVAATWTAARKTT